MKKLISLIMCAVMLFAFAACNNCNGCNNNDDSSSDSSDSGWTKPKFDGTGNYIFKNGKTNYKIVIPENSTEKERLAATELTGILSEATGVKLETVTDAGKAFTDNAEYISIGKTSLLEGAGIEISDDAEGINAFQISRAGKSLFLIGGKEYGVVYSVYEWLNDVVNFEQYYTDCYTLETSVIDIELKDYSLVCKPDILRTMGTAGFMAANKTIATRMRSPYNYTDVYATDNEIPFAHSSLKYLPLDKYYDEHPSWYSDDKTQLCYTAHGNSTEYNKMLTAFTERLKKLIIHVYGRDIHEYDLSNMDTPTCCSCKDCLAALEKYKSNAGAYIIFANKASEMIFDWMKNDPEGQKYYDEDFKIKVMAYHRFEAAPAVYDEATKAYKPAAPEIKLGDHVTVMIAPIYTNFVQSIYTENNIAYYKVIEGWKAVSSGNMDFWLYCTNFKYYMLPYDSFNNMIEYRKVLRDAGALSFNDQTQNGNYGGMSGWHILKAYLSSKLSYNVNLDMNELTDNFFDAYFDVAAEDMKEFYYGWRRFSLYQQNVLGAYTTSSSIYFEALNKKYWPKSVLDGWYKLANSALEKIEVYKTTDIDKYNTLYKHIVCERASIEYCYLMLYSSELGNKKEQIKANFIEAVYMNNINTPREGGSMSDLINSL